MCNIFMENGTIVLRLTKVIVNSNVTESSCNVSLSIYLTQMVSDNG